MPLPPGELGNLWTRATPPGGGHAGDLWSDGQQLYMQGLLGFLPIGGGGPVFNVQSFGADPTGVTDATTAIRAALTAATVAGGGVVLFPGGTTATYLIGASNAGFSITVPSGVTLLGYGAHLQRLTGNTERMIGATAALSDVNIVGLVIDNGSALIQQGMLFVPNGSVRVNVERTRFIGLAYVSAVWFDTGTVQGSDLTLYKCSFERTLPNGTGAQENVGVVWMHDASNITIEDCRFTNVGALEVYAFNGTACSSAAPMINVKIINNRFYKVKTTCIFVSATGSSYMYNVRVAGNEFENVGKEVEKGAIQAQQNGSGEYSNIQIVGNNIRDIGYEGSSTIGATTNAAQAINVGVSGTGTQSMVQIDDNVIDVNPTNPAIGGCMGVSVGGGVTDWSVNNNEIRNCGWAGIRVWGGSLIRKGKINDNTVDNCCQRQDPTNKPGGIFLQDYYQDIVIDGNEVTNCGPPGQIVACQGSGIALGTPTVTGKDVVITANRVTDTGTGASRKQMYGIRIGTVGQPDANQPQNITAAANSVDNNVTADWFYETTVDLGYRIMARMLDVNAAGDVRIFGNVGFYNTAPVAKPVIVGAKGGNVALGNLLNGLAGQGLITDNTT